MRRVTVPAAEAGSVIAAVLLIFYGYSLSAHWSLGKLLIVAVGGLWLSTGRYYRLGTWPLAYLAVLTLTSVTSRDPWLSWWGLWGTYNVGLLAALTIAPYWACVGPDDREGIERGLRVGGCIVAFVAALQMWGLVFSEDLADFSGRASSTLGSPVYLGAALALCYPFCRGYEKGLVWAALLASGSRGAWLAVLAGIVYEKWPTLSRRVRYWGVVGSLAILCVAFYIRPMSDLGRVVTWRAAWDAFASRPWVGWGTGNFLMVADVFRNPAWVDAYGCTTQDHAHNFFLEALATSGLFGALTLGGFLFTIWRSAPKRDHRAALIGVGLTGLLNPLPLVVKALCLALAASNLDDKREISESSARLCKCFFVAIFLTVLCLVSWDRLMTFYGDVPWCFSSQDAAYWAGILKEKAQRSMFKL